MTQHISIIGCDLISASLAKALKASDREYVITAIDDDMDVLTMLLQDGVIDKHDNALSAASLQSCDIVIIASSPDKWEALRKSLDDMPLHHVSLVMVIGSVATYASSIFQNIPQSLSVHPIAGGEYSGVEYSDAQMFSQKRVMLIPHDNDSARYIEHATIFWQAIGAECHMMSAEQHDMIYAHMVHLPQLCAYAAAGATLPHLHHHEDYIRFLQMAASLPDVSAVLFRHNQELILAAEHYLQILGHMLAELRTGSLEHSEPLQLDMAASCCPRILASCLISVITIAERKYDVKLASHATSAFADMTMPAMSEPDEDLARISEHSDAVVALLEMIEAHFRSLLVSMKRNDWEMVHAILKEAHDIYIHQLH